MKKQYSYTFALGIFMGLALTTGTQADEQPMARQPRQKRSCQERADAAREKVLAKCQKRRAESGQQKQHKYSCDEIANHVHAKVLRKCEQRSARKAEAQTRGTYKKQGKRSRRHRSQEYINPNVQQASSSMPRTQAMSQQIPVIMRAPENYNTGIVPPHLLPNRPEASFTETVEEVVAPEPRAPVMSERVLSGEERMMLL